MFVGVVCCCTHTCGAQPKRIELSLPKRPARDEMAADIDAVIAALRIALEEAQESGGDDLEGEVCDRWIDQLPDAWAEQWRHLKLAPDVPSRKRLLAV